MYGRFLDSTSTHRTFDKHFVLFVEAQQQCLAKAPVKFQNLLYNAYNVDSSTLSVQILS